MALYAIQLENTESWGVVDDKKICPPSGSTGANGKVSNNIVAVNVTDTPEVNSGSAGRPSCIYPDFHACIEEDWDKIAVYHWAGLPDQNGNYNDWDSRSFPQTGI